MNTESTQEKPVKQIDIIQEKCDLLGLNIYEVFREAKVPACTVSNWKKKNPKTFEIMSKIDLAMDMLSKNRI